MGMGLGSPDHAVVLAVGIYVHLWSQDTVCRLSQPGWHASTRASLLFVDYLYNIIPMAQMKSKVDDIQSPLLSAVMGNQGLRCEYLQKNDQDNIFRSTYNGKVPKTACQWDILIRVTVYAYLLNISRAGDPNNIPKNDK